MKSSISYHLAELDIARSEVDSRRVMPVLPAGAKVILDIGCGVGQTLMALNPAPGPEALLVGMDFDEAAVGRGRRMSNTIRFVAAGGEQIPLKDSCVDFAILRVSLPYMRVHTALREVHRILKPDGRAWFVLHSRRMYAARLKTAWRDFQLKQILGLFYVLINTIALSLFGVQFGMPNGKMETFQSVRMMTRLLGSNGFEIMSMEDGGHFVVEARAHSR